MDPAQEGRGGGRAGGDREPGNAEGVAKSIYASARGYERRLRAEGRSLPPEGDQLLLELYRELKREKVR